jgi:hypothetical protein
VLEDGIAPSDPLLQDALSIVAEGSKRGVAIRLLGGLAVACRCPGATALAGLRREYLDIDLVAHRREVREVRGVLEDLGYAADRRFNAINGDRRLLYADQRTGRPVDVFLDIFTMCHEFDFTSRLETDGETLSLADLLLTKLQVVEATDKDYRDTIALLLDHAVTDGDDGISREYLAGLCASDWELQTLVSDRLVQLKARLAACELDPEQATTVAGRVGELEHALSTSAKTRRWKVRAAVGRRKRWYELPEEKVRES